MAHELGRVLRAAAEGQVAGRGERQQLAGAELAHDVAGLEAAGDAHREVDALFDEVDPPVGEVHRQLDLGVELRERQHQRRQPLEAVAEGQAHPQLAPRGGALLHQLGFGGVDHVEDRPAFVEVGGARRGEREAARAAHHELDAQVLLQRRDLPGDHRAHGAELVGHRGKAAQLGHPHEGTHCIELVHCCLCANSSFFIVVYLAQARTFTVHPSPMPTAHRSHTENLP
jgi:hypothetical protein